MPRKWDTTHQPTTTCLTSGMGLQEDNFSTDWGGVGIVSGWFKHITFIVPLISNLLPSPIWQGVPVGGPKVRDPITTPQRHTGNCLHHSQKNHLKPTLFHTKPFLWGLQWKWTPPSSAVTYRKLLPTFSSPFTPAVTPPEGPEDTGFLSAWTGLRIFQKLKPRCVLRTTTSCLCSLSQASSRTQSRGDSQIQVNQSCDNNWPCRRPQVTMRFREKRLWVLRPTWCVARASTWFHRWVGLLGSVRWGRDCYERGGAAVGGRGRAGLGGRSTHPPGLPGRSAAAELRVTQSGVGAPRCPGLHCARAVPPKILKKNKAGGPFVNRHQPMGTL